MPSSTSRPWLRFSLRALLVSITLLCSFLAWETHVVRTRKQLREATAGKFAFQTAHEFDTMPIMYAMGVEPPPTARIFFVREWLGDEAIQSISYWKPDAKTAGQFADELKFYEQAFPEATFHALPFELPIDEQK
jgi:hypothetical protein